MDNVEVVGFLPDEESLVRHLHGRMQADGFALGELVRIEKRAMAGYNGLVEPALPDGETRLRTTLYLAAPVAFTIAHELAHVADIAVRHAETLLHLSASRPTHWHMAHRMGSEYYANRVASTYCSDDEIFPAFQNDRIGMIRAVRQTHWADLLVNYAMVLGIFHGLGRLDIEPLELLPDDDLAAIPDRASAGMAAFRRDADRFFRDYPLPG